MKNFSIQALSSVGTFAITCFANGATSTVTPDNFNESFNEKPVTLTATLKREPGSTYVEFGRYLVDGCDSVFKGKKVNSTAMVSGVVTDYSDGGMGQYAAPPSFVMSGCKLADGSGTASSVKAQSAIVSGMPTSNPVIDAWLKTCMPFNKPTEIEKQIRQGLVSWNGIAVSSVTTADSGSSSVVAVVLDQPISSVKPQFPDLAKKLRLPKNPTCPMGMQRSMVAGTVAAKQTSVECSCMTGGD